jgi:hypothetical protein
MDSQFLIVDLGWLFLAGWGTVLLALTAIVFGKDLRSLHRVSKTKVH